MSNKSSKPQDAEQAPESKAVEAKVVQQKRKPYFLGATFAERKALAEGK